MVLGLNAANTDRQYLAELGRDKAKSSRIRTVTGRAADGRHAVTGANIMMIISPKAAVIKSPNHLDDGVFKLGETLSC
jgi:hypothetical protein